MGETKGAFQGSQKQPDILIVQPSAQPVVIENEYSPAGTVEGEALHRLGERLAPGIESASGRVEAAIALRSPIDLRDCAGADQVDVLLTEGVTLEYALFAGPTAADVSRFPTSGFISGNIRDLAVFAMNAATPEDAVQRAVAILEEGVQDAASILREAAMLRESTQPALTRLLRQPYSEQTLRMTATIIVNALVFHQNMAGQHGVKSLDDIADDGILLRADVLSEWSKILSVNYWSIFSIASDLLRCINPPGMAADALQIMRRTADRLITLGVTQSHDLIGTVFQRLITDRKFLATFYTRPESATLLAHLALPGGGDWGSPERVKDFRIADYACGTGTLIHAAYRRLNRLHWLDGGDPEQLHSHMMANSLTACDVLPSAVHLTASMLSSTHPTQGYDGSRTIVAQYGKTEQGGVSLGSLDLLAGNGEVRPLIPLHSGRAVTGTGEAQSELGVEMPPGSQDLVIMNPPFTSGGSDYTPGNPAGYNKKQFHGLETDWDTQERMFNLAREYAKGTCAHGYAGLASWFVALSDKMVKKDGTIALVLPLTALQGSSWLKVRELIACKYNDVTLLSIAASNPDEQSFSADTGMAEVLLICRESSGAPAGRGMFVSLSRRPRNEMEASEIARAISALATSSAVRSLEDGPFGGTPLFVGDEKLGEVLTAPLGGEAPWPTAGIADSIPIQTAYQLAQGKVWLPQMRDQDILSVPMATLQQVCRVGITDNNIVGNGSQTAFDRIKSTSIASTYPMLWSHDAQREKRMVVEPDSEGRVKIGREGRAGEIWDTRSHAHHNRDLRFNSQPLAVAFTERQTIGGRAWPNVKFADRAHEIAYTVWGNTTLGLICYWWHSSRQQAGRGRMPITVIRTMPTLDVTKLSPGQLAECESIFEDMRSAQFLPANEAYHDNSRKELDYRVLIDMLGLPKSILEPLDLLRMKWCMEPSVHGGKRTAPDG